jgi:hypothetical protein
MCVGYLDGFALRWRCLRRAAKCLAFGLCTGEASLGTFNEQVAFYFVEALVRRDRQREKKEHYGEDSEDLQEGQSPMGLVGVENPVFAENGRHVTGGCTGRLRRDDNCRETADCAWLVLFRSQETGLAAPQSRQPERKKN